MTTLIGTNPDQIPVNSMLGGMAYQDPDSINVKDFNSSGTANIASLVSPAASITNLSYSGTLTGGTGVINIGSSQIYKDASGNIGVGITPSNSNNKTIEIGAIGNSLIAGGTNDFQFLSGTYYNSGYKYAYSSQAVAQYKSSGGVHTWAVAPSGTAGTPITWNQVMSLDSSSLTLSGTGATKLQEGTTAQRPASPQEGMIRKNSTLGVIEGYSEGGYVSLEAGRLIARTVYSTPGSYTWTPNSKTKHVIAILVSAGGGSGGCPPTNATQGAVSAPGKNGQYMRCEIPRDSTLGTNYAVVVGAGGSYGFGGVSPTSGGSGGDSSITNNTSGAVISVIGGGGGDPGYTSTTFPFVRSSDGAYLSTNTGGHFVIWERSFSVPIYCVLFGLNGDIMLSQPSVHSIGVSSGFKGRGARSCLIGNNSASGSTGFVGDNGEVIIYEYS